MYHLCQNAEKQTAKEQKIMKEICDVTASDVAKNAAKLGKDKILRVCTIV